MWSVAIMVTRRLASTVEATKPALVRSRRKASVTQQIVDYFQTSELFMTHYSSINPTLLKKRSAVPSGVYCMSESAAETVFSSIKGHLNPDTPIIELYPGLGILTSHLLTLNPKRILAYESDSYFKSVMDSIALENLDVLQVHKAHFMRLWSDDHKDKLDGGDRVAKLISGVEKKEWESDPVAQIIGVAANPRYFQFFVNCVAFQCGIMSYGRMELYLTVPPEIFWNINCEAASLPMMYSKYLLFNIFFDYELLCEVDGKCFVPWFKRDGKTAFLKDFEVNRENFCVMKAVPKRDLLKVVPPHLLTSLWFFTYQGTTTTRNKVIPYLEKWVPDCGPLFISKGLTVFTDFRDLKCHELLDVFLTFVSLPGFEDSTFHAALESFLYKSEDEGLDDEMDLATSGSSGSENVATENVEK
uniref:Dimethyladenosine transferase 2, mitochondrial n=1 Tax=Lygus hesperus TaxID=30085 RepID=A0A0A9W2A9_LYGHE